MENYEEMSLEDFEDKEEDKKEFIIDTVEKADWAIEKVVDEQRRFDLYEQAMKSKINKLYEDLLKEQQDSEMRTSWLRYKLGEYINRKDVPAKNTATQLSLKLPSGTVKFVKAKVDYDKNDDELLKYCKENAKEYVKTGKESVKWKELKAQLEIKDNMVLNKETGEIVEGISVIETLPKIEVK